AAIEQQLTNHQRFHTSIQRSPEMDRARDELVGSKGDKGSLHALEQEWDSLQQMSFGRTQQLQDLMYLIQEISREIMWVNDREEEELMFDWGDKNVDQYIPKKQESYSKLMSALEDKEMELNKLKAKVDNVLKNNHPAADKIEAYKDTLQTQWSWLLQITKCIDVHLKENGAYSQFFKEANDTYSALQKEHETVRKNYPCDKSTSLENLLELLRGLEREKEKIMENKRQVQHLVNRSKSIVRLKPRNPEEKSNHSVIVKALCDFKQDQKVICKDNEAILKDNSQRSKWQVTGPGGLDMLVPSVCLIVPPPNPLSISLANKNEQYYEAILSIWNQLYINVKSLIAWQYCLLDIRRINSLTINMLAKMRPEEYRQIIKSLETHYEEFKLSSHGSQMFADEDKRSIENQFTGAQAHYDQLKEVVKVVRTEPVRRRVSSSSVSSASSSSHSLSELHSLRLRLEAAESMLTQHLHVCVGEDAVHDCGLKIIQLETVQRDVDAMRDEYLSLRERILRELEGMNDSDKAQFLRSEIGVINQRLGSLECSSSAYVQRLRALRDMLESVARAEDIVKVHEARLTEKETTSLSPGEVDEYMLTLKNVKAELDQKKDVLASMEKELAKASHWNSQLGDPFHRCDMMLSKYTEQVGVLSDRWRRIQGQIDTRYDLKMYVPQLQHYKQTSTSLFDWIDATTKKQNALQATKIENIQALKDHITNQKALNTEIKAKRETVERVLKDNEACVNTIKDYETDLSSYTSGLETLLNVPIKRTMLKSPSMDLNQEAIQLQTRYMELLTMSGDYHKFLGESLKNMEELKIRNTRIDLLEEELRLLREDIQDCNGRNKSLEDTVARYQLELSQSQEQLLSVEEVKRNTALQCNATKESLDSTQSQLTELSDQVTRLTYLLDEEKRKRKLAEERYNQQQEEYESVLRKRQNELETVSWSKMDVEKSVANKDHEIENLRRQLDAETARVKELQTDISKVRSQCNVEINNLKLSYESQIHASCTDIQRLAAQRDEDAAELQMQYDRMEGERRSLEEEVRRLRMSVNQAEEQRMRTEEEAQSQRAVIIEEGRRRRELESQVELLMSQRDEENSEYREELAELMKALQDKSDQLAYVTHSLDEENRRRKTIEEGQAVLEQTVTQLQVKLTSSSVATTQLREYDEELQKMRLELERESKERSRVEQNISRLNSRIKDLQAVRDGLESQMENLRIANQEEVARRRQVEAELEKTTITMTEYATTITALRKSQEQASTSGKRGEEERLRLQEELERSLRENKTSAEHMTQLNTELKALQQQLLQEQARLKEAKLRNDGLYRTIEEKSKALNENTVQLESLKEMTETQTKERLRLEEELRAAHHDKEELLRSKQGMDDELSSQITALDLQLQASERSNKDYHSLVSELSSEREKLKLETENMQTQATEVHRRLTLTSGLLSSFQISPNLEHSNAELRNKQRLQEENERVKRDLSYWKDQCDSKQGMIRQYDTDKEILEREKKSLKSEIERLMRELKDLDETNKSRLSEGVTYSAMKRRCRVDPDTGLLLLPIPEKVDPSKLVFDGVRKPVTANQLFDCGVLDKPTFKDLEKGKKTVPEVSEDKKVNLKGTGPIAGVVVGSKGKMSFTQAKKQMLLSDDSADLLLEAQAATGHIIDPKTNQKLTVEEACAKGVVDIRDEDKLLAAEAAAIGYKDPNVVKPLSVFEAMKKGLIEKETALRLLQAQVSSGGILDPNLSVFLPKDTAIKRKIFDENLHNALSQTPECYLDPETEHEASYEALKKQCKIEPHTGLLLLPITEKLDPSKLIFDGVRKPVTAQQLLDCGVLDKPTVTQLMKGEKTVPEVSEEKKIFLKGTGSIAGVAAGPSGKVSFSEAKKKMLIPPDSADLLLEAQAATGHIIDPTSNQKLTVDEACVRGVVDNKDRDKLLAAERAAVGYRDPNTAKPLSVFEAMKKGMIDRNTGVRLLQAQELAGGILDPNLSVFLPKDTAIKRNLLDEDLCHALNQDPQCYLNPDTERNASYGALKKRCKTESHTGLILLPVDSADLLLEAQAATGHITDPKTGQKLTVEEACAKGVVDRRDRDRLLAAQAAAIGYKDPSAAKPLSVFEAMKKGLIEKETALRLLQAQVTSGGILDPNLNESLSHALNQSPACYLDPETKCNASYEALKKKCKTEPHTGLLLFPVTEQLDPSKLIFYGVRKPVTAQQLLDCGVLDKPTVTQLMKEEKTIPEVSEDKKVYLKGTGSIAGVVAGPLGKMSFSEAKKKMLMPPDSADLLLEAQAATGHIIDPTSNQKLTVEEACVRGVVENKDRDKLLAAERAAVGYRDLNTAKPLSVFEAMKKGMIDRNTGVRLLQAQELAGGILDPNLSVFLPKDTAIKRNLLDENLSGQAMKKGLIDKDTALRVLQAQECVGGILD
uniref:Desmoplakin b n=1 Tax=Amphiprion ocellaris TaxID=80972 RepID=A0A3Q1BGL8_AMPOC